MSRCGLNVMCWRVFDDHRGMHWPDEGEEENNGMDEMKWRKQRSIDAKDGMSKSDCTVKNLILKLLPTECSYFHNSCIIATLQISI